MDMPSSPPNPNFTCASCGSSFDWAPLFYRGGTYCCAGCACGGPCSCSYDGNRSDASAGHTPLPMIRSECERLGTKAARLRLDLAAAIERRHIDFGWPRDEGSQPVPVWEVEARQRDLALVEEVLARAQVGVPEKRPIVGAMVTLQSATGEIELFRLVPPGEEDHTLNRVSFDTPFGQLLSRSELGSSFAVKVVSGARRMTVVDISYPEEPAAVEEAAVTA